jgi:CRISP-associated protein Cas1
MQLFLDSFGAFLGVSNGQFKVRLGTSRAEHLFPVRDVDVIFLTRGTTHTTDALILALENDVPVVILDGIGHPIGQVWSGKFGSIATIRRNQLQFSVNTEGWLWLAKHLQRKIETQNAVLHQFSIHFNDDVNAMRRLGKVTSAMQGLSNKFKDVERNAVPLNVERNAVPLNVERNAVPLNVERNAVPWQKDTERNSVPFYANTFRAWEATASRYYFRFLASVVPPPYKFVNRNFRPSLDTFNCLLNYLYGMLYAYVELALMKSGIDPSIGILHVDRYNRPTMVYDFIEAYRHWADTVALTIVFNDYLPKDAFADVPDFMRDSEGDPEAQGFWLTKAGKPIVVKTFLDFMEQHVPYKHNQQKRFVILDLEAQALATLLKKYNSLDH